MQTNSWPYMRCHINLDVLHTQNEVTSPQMSSFRQGPGAHFSPGDPDTPRSCTGFPPFASEKSLWLKDAM